MKFSLLNDSALIACMKTIKTNIIIFINFIFKDWVALIADTDFKIKVNVSWMSFLWIFSIKKVKAVADIIIILLCRLWIEVMFYNYKSVNQLTIDCIK